MFWGLFFVENAKNDPRRLFERPKSYKFIENWENAEIARNSAKMAFLTFQTPKLGHFSRYLHEILQTYTPDRVLSHIFRFFENLINLDIGLDLDWIY